QLAPPVISRRGFFLEGGGTAAPRPWPSQGILSAAMGRPAPALRQAAAVARAEPAPFGRRRRWKKSSASRRGHAGSLLPLDRGLAENTSSRQPTGPTSGKRLYISRDLWSSDRPPIG